MKGSYKTKEGSKIEVLDFDEANKMVRIESGWVGFPEYSTWEKEGGEEVPETFPPIEEAIVGEILGEDIKESETIPPSVEEEKLTGEIMTDLENESKEPTKRKRIYKKKNQ